MFAIHYNMLLTNIRSKVGRVDEKITLMDNGKTNTLCLSLASCVMKKADLLYDRISPKAKKTYLKDYIRIIGQ